MPTEPFQNCTGKGVRVAIIDSGANPAHPHVDGIAGGVRIESDGSATSGDWLDYNGHGTAVAGAIREKAPEALLYAVKVFDRALTTSIDIIIRGIEWAIEERCHLINLSLGTTNIAHEVKLRRVASKTRAGGCWIVAARAMGGQPSLPGTLDGVIAVEADEECPREKFRVVRDGTQTTFLASPYPRSIPGVPRERNLSGISFAVANLTGFAARALEPDPARSIDSLVSLLANAVDVARSS